MNKQETIQVITLLAGNYDSIAKKDKTQKELMIHTWQACLGDLDYQLVLQGVKKAIIESPYPPTVHEIRKNVVEMIKPTTAKSAIEAWNEAHTMICNGIYMTQEQFELASPEVQQFFGNVKQVKELALCDPHTTNTVVKGQFLKQYDIIIEREKQQKLLPASMKELVNKLVEKMDVKKLEGVKINEP